MTNSNRLAFLVWRRSSATDAGNCVEIAVLDGKVFTRDSHDKRGPVLAFSPSAWQTFMARTKHEDGSNP
jgi:Domain of unknown function (DUF397)